MNLIKGTICALALTLSLIGPTQIELQETENTTPPTVHSSGNQHDPGGGGS